MFWAKVHTEFYELLTEWNVVLNTSFLLKYREFTKINK